MIIKSVRGAFSIEKDDVKEIEEKTNEFLNIFFKKNRVKIKNIIQVIISSTNDIKSSYPCKFFRKFGIDKPLLCVQEQNVVNSEKLIIRVLFLIRTFKKLKPIYLNRTKKLRPDIFQ